MSKDAATPLSLVLDTNVVLDLLIYDDPRVRGLGEALERGTVLPWANASTLGELKYVLAYPTFALDAEAQHTAFTRYARHVRMADETLAAAPPLPRCRDRADQKFLELTARVGATWLVSKDKRVLSMAGRAGLPFAILSTRELAERLSG